MIFFIFLSTFLACGDIATENTPIPKKEKEEGKEFEGAKKEKKSTVEDKIKEKVQTDTKELGSDRGKAVYISVCQQCHQNQGQGIPGLYPPLAGSDWLKKDPNVLIRIVLHGLQGPIKVSGQDYNQAMTALKNILSDQQIADVLTFVRSSWGNTESAIGVEEVTVTREQYKERSKLWTASELTSN